MRSNLHPMWPHYKLHIILQWKTSCNNLFIMSKGKMGKCLMPSISTTAQCNHCTAQPGDLSLCCANRWMLRLAFLILDKSQTCCSPSKAFSAHCTVKMPSSVLSIRADYISHSCQSSEQPHGKQNTTLRTNQTPPTRWAYANLALLNPPQH